MWDKNDKYATFIRNITQWLSTRQINKFTSKLSKIAYYPGENIDITVLAFDEKLTPLKNLNLKIIIQNLKTKEKHIDYLTETQDNYKFQTILSDSGRYVYKILYKDKSVAGGSFMILNSNSEKRDIGFNKINLSYISKISGGKSLPTSISKNHLSELVKKDKSLFNVITKKEIPLYKKLYIIILFIISFVLELYLRKKWGLI